MTQPDVQLFDKPLSRSDYLQVVRVGLTVNRFDFARQAVLRWLAVYPGDLLAGKLYAQALAGEGRHLESIRVLQGLTRADPENTETAQFLFDLLSRISVEERQAEMGKEVGAQKPGSGRSDFIRSEIAAGLFALVGLPQDEEYTPPWGSLLWLARQALQQGDLPLAHSLLEETQALSPAHPLVGITHLALLARGLDIDLETRCEIARGYHENWPDTLQFMLRLADWTLEYGQSNTAVALLHQSASRDLEGVVAARLWGSDHPYRSLWPDRMQLQFSLMAPAEVLARLGWNRLPSGVTNAVISPPVNEPVKTVVAIPSGAFAKPVATLPAVEESITSKIEEIVQAERSSAPVVEQRQSASTRSQRQRERRFPVSDLSEVRAEFERIARRLKFPDITRQDGRFPVYVILSLKRRLRSVFGSEEALSIESEIRGLAEAVRGRPGWGARVFFADDPVCTNLIGAPPVKGEDAWQIKLILADLDQAMARQGERIGALLIVGGPEIVPFHCLPNPMDDPDCEVPSDNPYSTRDENYFLPEWPVGRLPSGAGDDARLLIAGLKCFQAEHLNRLKKLSLKERCRSWFSSFFKMFQWRDHQNFGYSAEIWRQAAGAVFRPIGRPGRMYVSPPFGASKENITDKPSPQPGLKGIPVIQGLMGYINLHGEMDTPDWYGHRDLLRSKPGEDYPVALHPSDIHPGTPSQPFPRVIFSEACYGMHLQGRPVDGSIALKLLEAGCLAVVGSTSMAYGSIAAMPMVAADLLGYTFWRFIKQGMPAGEALRQAKNYLASERHRSQGYLDSEDQKTLISFVLYGDPLAEPLKLQRVPKSTRYQVKPLTEMYTICDRKDIPEYTGPVPAEVMDGVRQAVAKYLPGMSDAQLEYAWEHEPHPHSSPCNPDQPGPARSLLSQGKRSHRESNYRSVVTLSKQVGRSGDLHLEIARLTLDEQGNLVKLVVSR